MISTLLALLLTAVFSLLHAFGWLHWSWTAILSLLWGIALFHVILCIIAWILYRGR